MRVKYKSNSGPKGNANVRVLKTKTVVEFNDTRKYPEPFEISPEQTPDDLVTGSYYVRLNKTEDKIFGASLTEPGTYMVEVKEFVSRQDQPPTPRFVDRRGPFGDNGFYIDAHNEFSVILEVIEDKKFTGQTIFLSLWYLFSEDDETGNVYIHGPKGRANEVAEFMEATGAVEHDFEFADNILPELEDVILKENRAFLIKINEKGFTDSITELPEGMQRKK